MEIVLPKPEEIVASVQTGFFKPASQTRQVPMDDRQMNDMLSLMMAPEDKVKAAWQHALAEPVFQATVVHNVAARFKRPTTPAVSLFLSLLAKTPGDVVMYLTYAQYEASRHRAEAMDMEAFTNVFAMGFWTREDRLRLWEGQKAPVEWRNCDNLLDAKAVLDWINEGAGDGAVG